MKIEAHFTQQLFFFPLVCEDRRFSKRIFLLMQRHHLHTHLLEIVIFVYSNYLKILHESTSWSGKIGWRFRRLKHPYYNELKLIRFSFFRVLYGLWSEKIGGFKKVS